MLPKAGFTSFSIAALISLISILPLCAQAQTETKRLRSSRKRLTRVSS